MPARAFTLAIGQLERIIAVAVSSSLAAGTITLFNFARQLYILPIAILGATIGQASFPALVHARQEGRGKVWRNHCCHDIATAVFCFPGSRFTFGFKNSGSQVGLRIQRISLGSHTFNREGCSYFLFICSGSSHQSIVNPVFYAAQNTKIPLISAIISTLPVILLAPYLSIGLNLGILGIVTAIVISDFFNVIILTVVLNILIVPGLIKRMAIPLLKSSLPPSTGIFLWIPLRLLDQFVFDTTRTLPLIGLSTSVLIIGLTVYLILAKLLRIDQLSAVLSITQKIGNWRQVLSESEEVLEPTAGEG